MKRLPLFLIAGLCAGSIGLAHAQSREYLMSQARSIAISFGNVLKNELQTAMQSGGPVTAVAACNIKAPAIARNTSATTGWDVGRTSLKLRNVANRPDDWELKVLRQFEARMAQGQDPQMLEFSEIVRVGGKPTFRYMKAIPTQELCLNCHGTDIKPEVKNAIKGLYPADQATGFKVGDLRGAFTLSKPL